MAVLLLYEQPPLLLPCPTPPKTRENLTALLSTFTNRPGRAFYKYWIDQISIVILLRGAHIQGIKTQRKLDLQTFTENFPSPLIHIIGNQGIMIYGANLRLMKF